AAVSTHLDHRRCGVWNATATGRLPGRGRGPMMRFDAPDVPRASHQLPAVLPLPRSEFHVSEAPSAYRRAGVDIDKKYAAVAGASAAIRSTFTKGVVGDVGLFGGLFDPAAAGAGGQLLVASTDGVGPKGMIAAHRGELAR